MCLRPHPPFFPPPFSIAPARTIAQWYWGGGIYGVYDHRREGILCANYADSISSLAILYEILDGPSQGGGYFIDHPGFNRNPAIVVVLLFLLSLFCCYSFEKKVQKQVCPLCPLSSFFSPFLPIPPVLASVRPVRFSFLMRPLTSLPPLPHLHYFIFLPPA